MQINEEEEVCIVNYREQLESDWSMDSDVSVCSASELPSLSLTVSSDATLVKLIYKIQLRFSAILVKMYLAAGE